MTDLVQRVTLKNIKKTDHPAFKAGDTVSVSVRVREGEKERIQLFKGVVLKIQGAGASRSFTVRKISAGVGVERTFPFASPIVDKVEILSVGKVRQGRIYFIRGLKGKAAKLESEIYTAAKEVAKAAPTEA